VVARVNLASPTAASSSLAAATAQLLRPGGPAPFAPTVSPIVRSQPTVTLCLDDGTVLITGGSQPVGDTPVQALASAALPAVAASPASRHAVGRRRRASGRRRRVYVRTGVCGAPTTAPDGDGGDMAAVESKGNRHQENPWQLKTPSGTSTSRCTATRPPIRRRCLHRGDNGPPLPASLSRRSPRQLRKHGDWMLPRQRRRAEAGGRRHGRSLGAFGRQPGRRLVRAHRRDCAAGSGCTSRRSWRSWAWPRSSTTPKNNRSGHLAFGTPPAGPGRGGGQARRCQSVEIGSPRACDFGDPLGLGWRGSKPAWPGRSTPEPSA